MKPLLRLPLRARLLHLLCFLRTGHEYVGDLGQLFCFYCGKPRVVSPVSHPVSHPVSK